MTDIYTLGIKADTTDIDRGKTSLDNLAGGAENAEKKTSKMREGLNDAGKAVAAFGVATAAALTGITVAAAQTAAEIEKLARTSGLTNEEFQRQAFAAKTVGLEMKDLSDIYKDAQDRVGDFLVTGGGPMLDFFEQVAPKIGVTAEQFRNLNGKDALELYVSSLEKANLSQSEMVFFMEAMSSETTELLPLLKDGAKGFNELANRADDLGLTLSDFDISNLKQLDLTMNEFQATAAGVSNVIGATLAPFVDDLLGKFLDTVEGGDDLRDTILDIARAGVRVAGVFADAGRVFEIFGKSIAAAIFTGVEAFDTFEKRIELLLVQFFKFSDEMDLAVGNFVNDMIESLNSLPGVDIDFIDLTGLESQIQGAQRLIDGMQEGLVTSNQNISNAWQDVLDLMSEPLPSEGFNVWFDAVEKAVEQQKKLQKEIIKTGGTVVTTSVTAGKADAKLAQENQDRALSEAKNIASITQTMFKEGTAAREVAHKAEIAFTAIELTLSLQRSLANAGEAITAAFAAPWPIGFASGAAMIGIMSGLGFFGGSSGGSGGGSSSAPADTTQQTASNSGLDDASSRLEDIQVAQLVELRGIREGLSETEREINALAVAVAGGDFSGISSVTLNDQYTGSTPYQSGNVVVVNEQQVEMQRIFDELALTAGNAAGAIGLAQGSLEGFGATFTNFETEGKTAEEVLEEITNQLGREADALALHLVPELENFQQVGEELFDTLIRVSQEQSIFNDTIDMLGLALGDLSSLMSVEVAQSVIDLTGGLERFTELTGIFFEEFFSEEQQFEQLTSDITEALGAVGVGMFETREQFTAFVTGLDLTTEAGQKLFAALIELSPAIDEMFDTIEDNAEEAKRESERISEEALRNEIIAAEELAVALDTGATKAFKELSKVVKQEVSQINDVANAQIATMGAQLNLVNEKARDLSALSDMISATVSGVSGFSREEARRNIQNAINTGDLSGVGDSVSRVAEIDRASFGSLLEFQKESARTNDELLKLKELADGQLTEAEMNAELIEQQIDTIRESADRQVEELQAGLETAEEQLNTLRGIEAGVNTLADAQTAFNEAIASLTDGVIVTTAAATTSGTIAAKSGDSTSTAFSTGDTLAAIAVQTQKTAKILNRWDGDGMPPERTA